MYISDALNSFKHECLRKFRFCWFFFPCISILFFWIEFWIIFCIVLNQLLVMSNCYVSDQISSLGAAKVKFERFVLLMSWFDMSSQVILLGSAVVTNVNITFLWFLFLMNWLTMFVQVTLFEAPVLTNINVTFEWL